MSKHRHHHHKKDSRKPLAPGFFNSPFVHGLLNLIPLVIIFNLFILNFFQTDNSKFKTLALSQSQPNSSKVMELAVRAAEEQDYPLAQSLYSEAQAGGPILGADLDAEKIIFPEFKLEKDIEAIQAQASILPSRTLYLKLAVLEWRLNQVGKAQGYLDLARELDPNDPDLSWVEKTIQY